jgi:hypothetical protein
MRRVQIVSPTKRSCRTCAKNRVCYVWKDMITPAPLSTYDVLDRNVMIAIHNVIGYHCSQFESDFWMKREA